MKSKWIYRALMVVVPVFVATVCHAQTSGNYPSRPIRMIVPFAPGGASDIVARVLQPKLTEVLGQQVVVDNRTGAAGNIGVEIAANAPPDGYTIFLGNNGTMAINPAVFLKFPIKPVRDFVCLSTVAEVTGGVAMHPSIPGKTLNDLIAYAKARPGQLNYGTASPSSSGSLTMEYIKLKTGIDIVQVPYKGGAGPATIALLGGEVKVGTANTATLLPYAKSGRVKVLAVVAAKRFAQLPDTPTMFELGFKDIKNGSWQALYVPRGTPQPIVQRLHTAIIKVMTDPAVVERLTVVGVDAVSSKSLQDCANFTKTEFEFWGKLVKQVGATAN